MGNMSEQMITDILENYRGTLSNYSLCLKRQDGSMMPTISVKRMLTIAEKSDFIDRVLEACFLDDDYFPEYFEPAFQIMLLVKTTDFKVYELLEDYNVCDMNIVDYVDFEKTYELCKAIDLERNVIDPVFQRLVKELRMLAHDAVEFQKQTIIKTY